MVSCEVSVNKIRSLWKKYPAINSALYKLSHICPLPLFYKLFYKLLGADFTMYTDV